MPIVNVPGVGQVNFPDNMSHDEIVKAIENDILKPAEPGVKDYLKDIPKAVGRGAVGLGETAAIGASALLPDEYEEKARRGIESLAKPAREYLAPSSQEVGESVSSQISSGLGSTLPFFIASKFGAPGKILSDATALAAGAGESRTAAEQAGATKEERSRATMMGAPVGLLDIIAPELKPFGGILTTAALRGGIEGLTEAAQQVAQNLIAKGVYNPNQEITVGAGEQGAYGAGTGALASLIVDLTLGHHVHTNVNAGAQPARAAANQAVTPAAPVETLPQSQPVGGGFDAQQAAALRAEADQAEKDRLAGMQEPAKPLMLGYSPLPGTLIGTTSGQVALSPEQELAERYKPQLTEEEKQRQEQESIQQQQEQQDLQSVQDELAQRQAIRKAELEQKFGKQRKSMAGPFTAEEREALGIPVAEKKAAPQYKATEHPENKGFVLDEQGQPQLADIAQGGAKFKTKAQADEMKGNLADYKAVQMPGGGWALSPKTDAELAKESGSKLRQANVSAPGMPVAAHELIAREGGLNADAAKNANVSQQRVGNRYLVAGKGKGLSADQVRSLLESNGYIDPETATDNDALTLIGDSVKNPKYTSEGYEHIARMQSEQEANEAEKANAVQNLTTPEAPEFGYQPFEATPAQARDAIARVRDAGFNADSIMEQAHEDTKNGTDQDFHRRVVDLSNKALGISGNRAPVGPAPIMETLNQENGIGGNSPTKEGRAIQNQIEGKTFNQVVQWSVSNAPNNFANLVARKVQTMINELQKQGVKFNFNIEAGGARDRKMRNAEGKTSFSWSHEGSSIAITLNGEPVFEKQFGYPSGMSYSTIQHELLHAATRSAIRFLPFNHPAVKDLRDLHNTVLKQYNADLKAGTLPDVLKRFSRGANNVLENPDELLTWGLTDHEFQNYLAKIKVGPSQTAFSKLVQAIRDLLGLPKHFESALEKLVRTTESILDVNIEEVKGGMAKQNVIFGKSKPTPQMGRGQQQSLFSQRIQRLMRDDLLSQNGMPVSGGRGALNLAEKPTSIYKGLPALGYERLEKGNKDSYKDKGGNEYATFVKNGVKIALGSNSVLYENQRGQVEEGYGEPEDSIVHALIVDPKQRKKGLATNAMQDLVDLADMTGTNLYLEPTPIMGGTMKDSQLASFYKRFGFDQTQAGSDKVLSRSPQTSAIQESLFKSSLNQRTRLGNDAMDIIHGMGRQVAEPDPTRIEKMMQHIADYKENPKEAREQAYGSFRKFADSIETAVFSSDAALNNQISRAIMESHAGQEHKIGALLNTSLSQTVHSDATAGVFLRVGNIDYNPEIYKWEGVKDDNNVFNLSKTLDEIAGKHGLSKEEIELIAHTAFEARRTDGLIRHNEELEDKANQLRILANMERKAGRAVHGNALSQEAAKLLSQKKNVMNMTPEQLQGGLQLYKMFPELSEVTKIWNGIRENALNVMVKSGLYTRSEAEMLMDVAEYVPFYREEQLEENKGPKEFLKSLSVQADKRLKGSAKPVNDIFDNMVRWAQYAINRSVRNRSAVALVDTASNLGFAQKIKDENNPNNLGFIGVDKNGSPVLGKIKDGAQAFSSIQQAAQANKGIEGHEIVEFTDENNNTSYALTPEVARENVVKIWKDGRQVEYSMADPLFMEAFKGIESVSIPTVKFFSKFASVLRNSVVLYPLFSVTQVPQDSFAAMFSSGLKPQYALSIPVRAVKEFIQTLRGKSKTHEELKNVGAVGVRDFTSAIIRADAEIAAGLKVDKSIMGTVKRWLGNIAMAADNSVRQAVYEASLAQGLSRAEAIEKSFEVFNVRRRGSSAGLALAGQVIPFFNAYLTAQHVAYRTLTGVGISPTERKAAFQTLLATTGSVMALSLLYAMMNADDDDYINKPTPTRDRLLMIPGTGGVSIPLRSDLFLLPKAITEHMYLLLTDNGYEDGAKFRSSMSSILKNAIFSPTPVPQAIKPLAEIAMNYDFFQQKPLVGIYQQKKEIGRQFDESTSEFSKLLGQTGMISPIMADHFIRGMFGSVGGLGLYMTNPILSAMSGTPRPSMSMNDALATIPSASAFLTKQYEVGLSKDFYALKEATDRVAATVSDMKEKSPRELADYLSDPQNRERFALSRPVTQIANKLTTIRKSISTISNMPADQMSDEQKMRKIQLLQQNELSLLKGLNIKRLREQAGL